MYLGYRSGGLDLAFTRLSAFVYCFWAHLLFVDGHKLREFNAKRKNKKKEKVLARILRVVELSGTFGSLWRIADVLVVVRPKFTRTGTICCRVAQRRGILCGHWGLPQIHLPIISWLILQPFQIWMHLIYVCFFWYFFIILSKLCNELYGHAQNHIWVFYRAMWVGGGTIWSTGWSCRVIHHNLTVVFVMFHMDSSQRSPLYFLKHGDKPKEWKFIHLILYNMANYSYALCKIGLEGCERNASS